jgi:hypothetical protein
MNKKNENMTLVDQMIREAQLEYWVNRTLNSIRATVRFLLASTLALLVWNLFLSKLF